jgi:hypothetical protein
MMPNLESTKDVEWFRKNLSHKIFEISGQGEIWYFLHEWPDDVAHILDVKQELIPEYIRYSVLH